MTCEQAKPLLGAYHDGELSDIERIVELEGHISDCPNCSRDLQSLKIVSRAIKDNATSFEASKSLRDRVHAATRTEKHGLLGDRTSRFMPRATGLALAFGACAVIAIALVLIPRSRPIEQLGSELVADHVRSLQANHLFDVASSNQHTVKPWFQGKLDFSPSVPDLEAAGFPLLGGRLDYVNNRPAAALVYRRLKHLINVFVFRDATPITSAAVDGPIGFHIVQWQSGDLRYCAVSDVNIGDLEQLAKDFQAWK